MNTFLKNNIRLEYLYRDGGNYKQFGTAIFTNKNDISINLIRDRIANNLIEGTWFYADKWGLKDLHYYKWDNELDHTWHEFENVVLTNEIDIIGDIDDFLARIEALTKRDS